jgi:hypothetical protein
VALIIGGVDNFAHRVKQNKLVIKSNTSLLALQIGAMGGLVEAAALRI